MAVLAIWGLIRVCAPEKPQVSYLTEKVRRGDIVKTVVTTGEVAAAKLVEVGAQVSGKIENLLVVTGQEVGQDELIAEIDSTAQRNELAAGRARLESYEAQLLARQVALKTAQAKYDREYKLIQRDATVEENLNNAEQALAAAQAALAETESLILQARIAVDTAETNLGYTRITSPLAGTVVSVPVEKGQTVNANQQAPTIARIADLSRMEIKMQISEGDVTKLRPGLKVSYTILSEPDRVFTGVLDSMDPGLTALSDGGYTGSTSAGTAVYYYGKLKADNADGTLRIGMTTQNTIVIDEVRDALMVPSIAVSPTGRDTAMVRVLQKGRPRDRAISIGLSDNMNTQVLSGLEEGEEVVAAQMSAAEVESAATVRMRGGPPRF
ncbi:MAG: efflux RND transporter periplasmic adaptor subunit [Candidatus Adiutrix sp.]|nr:efflux RND transporter periplasmic adaptor subunit [Candidatus Adiutrix sp.]